MARQQRQQLRVFYVLRAIVSRLEALQAHQILALQVTTVALPRRIINKMLALQAFTALQAQDQPQLINVLKVLFQLEAALTRHSHLVAIVVRATALRQEARR